MQYYALSPSRKLLCRPIYSVIGCWGRERGISTRGGEITTALFATIFFLRAYCGCAVNAFTTRNLSLNGHRGKESERLVRIFQEAKVAESGKMLWNSVSMVAVQKSCIPVRHKRRELSAAKLCVCKSARSFVRSFQIRKSNTE